MEYTLIIGVLVPDTVILVGILLVSIALQPLQCGKKLYQVLLWLHAMQFRFLCWWPLMKNTWSN